MRVQVRNAITGESFILDMHDHATILEIQHELFRNVPTELTYPTFRLINSRGQVLAHDRPMEEELQFVLQRTNSTAIMAKLGEELLSTRDSSERAEAAARALGEVHEGGLTDTQCVELLDLMEQMPHKVSAPEHFNILNLLGKAFACRCNHPEPYIARLQTMLSRGGHPWSFMPAARALGGFAVRFAVENPNWLDEEDKEDLIQWAIEQMKDNRDATEDWTLGAQMLFLQLCRM